MSDTVIQVENLGKKYMIGHQQQERYTALRDVMANGAKSLGQRLLKPWGKQSANPAYEEFWALKDVSFEVKQGDRVGIIGRNGAGKSTLLKILSRITEPTTGKIRIKGRVASLLEVGTGFHPELTGRENIYLNGAILGMSKAEIKRKFDEIVAFAEVEKFLDTPVKRYSSGMYVRLAFAVAAHLEPEILVVDEVLAVGDAQFQKKCLGKMEEVGKEGRTVLFVSHNMEAVQQLCKGCLLLEHGNLILESCPDEVVPTYLKQWHNNLKHYYKNSSTDNFLSQEKACLLEAEVLDSQGKSCHYLRFGEPFYIRCVWQNKSRISGVSYTIRVYNNCQRLLFAVNTINTELKLEDVGIHKLICKFNHNVLIPGEYYISLGCCVRPYTKISVVEYCLSLLVKNIAYFEGSFFEIKGNPTFHMHPSWQKK